MSCNTTPLAGFISRAGLRVFVEAFYSLIEYTRLLTQPEQYGNLRESINPIHLSKHFRQPTIIILSLFLITKTWTKFPTLWTWWWTLKSRITAHAQSCDWVILSAHQARYQQQAKFFALFLALHYILDANSKLEQTFLFVLLAAVSISYKRLNTTRFQMRIMETRLCIEHYCWRLKQIENSPISAAHAKVFFIW